MSERVHEHEAMAIHSAGVRVDVCRRCWAGVGARHVGVCKALSGPAPSGPAYLHEDGTLAVCKGGGVVRYRVRGLEIADEETR